MTFDEIKNSIINRFGDSIILKENISELQSSITIDPAQLVEFCNFLQKDENLYFDYLNCLSAVDYATDAPELAIVYHVSSIPYKHSFVFKVMLPIDRNSDVLPSVHSISSVWRSADWHEREAYDLMGIQFINHPDLRRILCPDDWEGHPLRKDYQAAEKYNGLTVRYNRKDEQL